MKVTYRKGTMEDLKEIGRLVQQAIETMEKQEIHQWDELYPIEEDFEEDIKRKQLFVGMVGEEIAVIYVLNQECDEEYKNARWEADEESAYMIHRLCVRPSFQHGGIAKQTMANIELQVLEQKGQSIRLDVFSENPFATRLYKGCGYCITGEAHWRKGTFYLMEKCLDRS